MESDALRDTRRGATTGCALAQPPHASAESTNSYAHAAGLLLTRRANVPSAAAPELPAVTRHTRRSHGVPPLTSFLLRRSFAKAVPRNVDSAHALEQCLPRPLAHRAGRRPALGKPGRPQRGAGGRPPFLDVSRTGHRNGPARRRFERSAPARDGNHPDADAYE